MVIDILIGDLPWIEAQSFQFGTQHSNVVAGGVDSKALPHDCVFTKEQDENSQSLVRAAAVGQHFAKATVEFSKPEPGGSHIYLTVVLKDVMITAFTNSSS